jgi:TonB family protein
MFRLNLFLLLQLAFFTSLVAAGPAVTPLQTSAESAQSGIEFYEKGNFPEAVQVFKVIVKQDKNNVQGWHYLGLAFEGLGKSGDARKAHEKAAKSGEALLVVQMGKTNGPEYLDSLRPISSQLHYAAESATRYLRLSPDLSKSKQWEANERADLLIDFEKLSRGESASEALGRVIPSKGATVRARILSKPEPQYTEEARQNKITGTVILRAILGRDGKVHAIIPVRSLPYGLTAKSILAAHAIRFEPATKDGQPVSVAVQLEYNFNVY